jgi:L-seryl-tRNA(Ser) seleniumtransferase
LKEESGPFSNGLQWWILMAVNPFRALPAVNEVLQAPAVQALTAAHPHERIAEAVRQELAELRRLLAQGTPVDGQTGADAVAARVVERLGSGRMATLRPVINATGIILHTNLGRAPLAERAAQAAYEAARGYLNLELDLQTGKRASRQAAVRPWVCLLTGAESATVVNNNAAATVVALRALCAGKEVIISRGQLIEIGGSFRIPEIMAVSGAILKEVGTTNITRLADYEGAIGPQTAAFLRVHTSNYRVRGFTKSVPFADLAALGKKHGVKVIDDIGSGALIDLSRFGGRSEPVARASIAAGADLVLFSCDKLLGGPQAGILAGKKELIQKIEKDPLMRTFRCGKMTLAALEETLRLYLHGEQALSELPTLRMLTVPYSELQKRAEALAHRLRAGDEIESVTVGQDETFAGGGSLPDQGLKTCVIHIQAKELGATELAWRLRSGNPAVMGRLKDGKLVLDVRTVFERQEAELVEAVRAAAKMH